MAISVRKGNDSDIVWILPELEEFSKDFGTEKQLFINNDQTVKTLLMLMDDHLFLVAEDVAEDKEPMGFMSGLFHGHLYNPEIKVLTENLWWVKK